MVTIHKIFIVTLMSLSTLLAWSKSVIVDEISFPISEYKKDGDDHYVRPNPYGELRIILRYYDTFENEDNNAYQLEIIGYSDSSENYQSMILSSTFSGRSQNEINRNSWGRNKFITGQREIVESFVLLSNGHWNTMFALFKDGEIRLVYGPQMKDVTTSIKIEGNRDTWNRLVRFLESAWGHNIGRMY